MSTVFPLLLFLSSRYTQITHQNNSNKSSSLSHDLLSLGKSKWALLWCIKYWDVLFWFYILGRCRAKEATYNSSLSLTFLPLPYITFSCNTPHQPTWSIFLFIYFLFYSFIYCVFSQVLLQHKLHQCEDSSWFVLLLHPQPLMLDTQYTLSSNVNWKS